MEHSYRGGFPRSVAVGGLSGMFYVSRRKFASMHYNMPLEGAKGGKSEDSGV